MLLPETRAITGAELLDLYDWPRPDWVRGCMVRSLDGAVAGPDGLSGSISSPADRAVLAAVRALADAYLVGAGTVRAERYSAVRARPELRQRRSAAGQAAAPTLAVVSRTCRFDWADVAFPGSTQAPLILTTQAAPDEAREAARAAGCEVVVVGQRDVYPPAALSALRERGLTRIVAEGGPQLLAQLVGHRLLDELDLTVSPTTVAAPQPAQAGPATLTRMRLHHLLEEDGFLFARYRRAEEP